MFGYYKGQPTDYVIKYVRGSIVKEGPGLAFAYLTHNTHIVAVPTSSRDANFVFNEVTDNFQAVAIQGQCTYRIANPKLAASLLNFTLNRQQNGYLTTDHERLPQRITNIVQMETRSEIQKRSLEETLGQSQTIAATVFARIREAALLEPIGAEMLSIYFVALKPTPEVAKALESEYRESLLRKADEAIYARRGAAITEERKIKESELNTEIALEQQKKSLIDLAGNNALQEAEYRGKALVQEADSKAKAVELELAAYSTADPRQLLALAMRDIGQNAKKIGNLNITPELLASLLNEPGTTRIRPE